MAKTLKARAGSDLVHEFPYVDAQGNAIDTTGFVGRLALRAAHAPERILLQAQESDTEGSFLFRSEGGWVMTLPPAFTPLLPPTTRFELELASDTEEPGVTTIEIGVIKTEPEVVHSA